MRKPAPLLEYLEAAFRDSAYALGQLRRKELDKITMEATAKSLTAAANRLHREAGADPQTPDPRPQTHAKR